jgi:CBS domain-containing protein
VIGVDQVDGLTAADLVHRRLSTMPAAATVAEVRAFFGSSTSHHVALLTDGERYVGSIDAGAIADDVDDSAPAAPFAQPGPRVEPGDPAAGARDAALAQASLRVAVVDGGGALVGIVAVTLGRDGFCGT